MDADDISIKERLKTQKEYLENNGLDFVFSGITIINEKSQELFETNKNRLTAKQTKKLLEIVNISNHPTWFLKSKVYKELGGYREVNHTEDYDFTLRSLNKIYDIGKMNVNVLKYRVRENSISVSNSLEDDNRASS